MRPASDVLDVPPRERGTVVPTEGGEGIELLHINAKFIHICACAGETSRQETVAGSIP